MCDAMEVFNPVMPMEEVEKTCILVAWVSPKVKEIMHFMRSGWIPTLQEVKDV